MSFPFLFRWGSVTVALTVLVLSVIFGPKFVAH